MNRPYLLELSEESALYVLGPHGRPIAILKLQTGGPGVLFFDGNGFLRCRVEFEADGSPRVEQFDKKTGEAVSRLLVSDETD